MRWFLVVLTVALAPTVVHAWEYGPRVERERLRIELRRGWNEAIRETRRTIAEARREMRRVRAEQRHAIREAMREARRAARDARRYLRW
jgi:hypothetical protein